MSGSLRHFLTILDTPTDALVEMLERAQSLRTQPEPSLLARKTLCCLFEKPSLRTRVSFEQAMRRLGGTAMSMSSGEIGIGGREAPEDIARVLSSMVECIMARVMSHHSLERMASVSAVPVVNGLSDTSHPAQALADMLTMMDEFSPGNPRGLAGRTIAFVGDGNNVASSLAVACARLGMKFRICSPEGYELDDSMLAKVRASIPGASIEACEDPAEAVLRADAVYCDTFISMGQEHEHAERMRVFQRFQVNDTLLRQAPVHAIVLHCLPAHRGVEISADVIDGPRSRVFKQDRNRLDAQMGLLATLLG
jgi:ornithine carbamoyltransferase